MSVITPNERYVRERYQNRDGRPCDNRQILLQIGVPTVMGITGSMHRVFGVTNTDGEKIMLEQKKPTMSMKTLGVNDAPAGGNVAHLEYLSNKSKVWINRMKNGHLPSHIAWMAYKLQLWASLRYGIGTMRNNI